MYKNNNFLIVFITDNFFCKKINIEKYDIPGYQTININIQEATSFIEENYNIISSIVLIPTKGYETQQLLKYIKSKNLTNNLLIMCDDNYKNNYLNYMLLSIFDFIPLSCTNNEIKSNIEKKINNRKFNIQSLIDNYLFKLGASPKLKGYKYIKESIYICIHDTKQKIKLGNDLYNYLSKKYQTTASAVESAIRRTIEKMMDNSSIEIKESIFSALIYNNDEELLPSNGLFIKTIAKEVINIINLEKDNTLFL